MALHHKCKIHLLLQGYYCPKITFQWVKKTIIKVEEKVGLKKVLGKKSGVKKSRVKKVGVKKKYHKS